jgi:hypothetical protein
VIYNQAEKTSGLIPGSLTTYVLTNAVMSKRNERNERNYRNYRNERNYRNQMDQLDEKLTELQMDVPQITSVPSDWYDNQKDIAVKIADMEL